MNKLVTLCAVLLGAACQLVQSYDFQDAAFNEVLSSELEEIFDTLDKSPLHARARRNDDVVSSDEKCRRRHHRKPKLCCGEEVLESLQEKEKEIVKLCFKETAGAEKEGKHDRGFGSHRNYDLFSCDAVEKRKSDMICVEQCKLEKLGLVSEDGSPNLEQVSTYLNEAFAPQAWFEKVSKEIVSKCVNEAINATANPVKFYTDDIKVCNRSGIVLKHCLFNSIQLSCPADQIKDKNACERFQERAKKGKDLFDQPPGPPPFDDNREE